MDEEFKNMQDAINAMAYISQGASEIYKGLRANGITVEVSALIAGIYLAQVVRGWSDGVFEEDTKGE